MIIHLQNITNELPDVFTDNKKIVKFHILTANTRVKIDVLKEKLNNITVNEFKTSLKRGRPISAKEKKNVFSPIIGKYSFAPTQRYSRGVKHILRYFHGIVDM